jgi:tetratricopeptide (TPR) repeat protein
MANHEKVTDGAIEPAKVKKPSRLKWWLIGLAVVVVLGGGAVALVAVHIHSTNNSPKALMQKGLLAQENGDNTLAASYYNQVIAQDTANTGEFATYAYYNLGVINTSEGNTAVAIGDYTNAIQLDAKYLPALFNLAVVETTSDPTLALANYDKILAIKPNDPNTLFNAGLVNNQLGNVALAKKEVKLAIKFNPSLATRVPANFPSLN